MKAPVRGLRRKPSPAKRAAAPKRAATPKRAAKARPADAIAKVTARLRRVVDRRVRALEQGLAKGGDEDAIERNARLLASLVKTLAELARLEAGRGEGKDRAAHDSHDADRDAGSPLGAPLDLARLRAELARRLRGAGGGETAGEPAQEL